MASKRINYLTSIFLLCTLPFLSGCLFEQINQPSSAQPGEVIDIYLTITDNIVPEPNAHTGIIGIIAPSDWDFVSASYSSTIGSGELEISIEWKDSLQKYYPPEQFGSNMEWIALISDKGYSYQEVTSFNIQLKLKAGQTLGCFNLGYITTKATGGLLGTGNPSWAPLSYPHPIAIPDSNLCSSKYETMPAPEWDNLFDRKSGWTGADGIYSIPLDEYDAPSNSPAGKQLFLFSDTFIGEVDADNKRVNTRLINNTLALLQSNQPDTNKIRFFWKTDLSGNAKSVFVPNTPNANPGDWYWLMDGIAIKDTVYVFALRLNSTSGGWGFEINGVALLKFSMDDNNFISEEQQYDTPLFYKDSASNSEIVFGQAVMPMTSVSGNPSPDGYIYIYGPKDVSLGKELVAARVLPGDIEDFDKWQYWNGTEWGNQIEDCQPLISGISQEFSVTPIGGSKYLLVYQSGNSVAIRIGESPVGPFGIFYTIYNCPEVTQDPDIFVYNAKAHPGLSRADELLISYNVNTFDFGDLINNADIYRPRFIYLKINDSTSTGINNVINSPSDFLLNQNYPNPFNPSTIISYQLPVSGIVTIKIFNALGENVQTLLNEYQEAGFYSKLFNPNLTLTSGVYFYRIEAGEFVQTKKMILIR